MEQHIFALYSTLALSDATLTTIERDICPPGLDHIIQRPRQHQLAFRGPHAIQQVVSAHRFVLNVPQPLNSSLSLRFHPEFLVIIDTPEFYDAGVLMVQVDSKKGLELDRTRVDVQTVAHRLINLDEGLMAWPTAKAKASDDIKKKNLRTRCWGKMAADDV